MNDKPKREFRTDARLDEHEVEQPVGFNVRATISRPALERAVRRELNIAVGDNDRVNRVVSGLCRSATEWLELDLKEN